MPLNHDLAIVQMAELRESLKSILKPEVLNSLVEFIEATGDGDSSMIERYKWFVENSNEGESCRYAKIAKNMFLENGATQTARTIRWLYENWAKYIS